ncbi:MAG TPA: GFA family protein [Polyangiaceae bacterium]|jgi:hypothetical protein
MHVEGACHCGHVTFTAEVDPASAGVCHCSDCQTITGSAFRTTVRSLPGTFALRSGTPTLYIKATAESGTRREHAFCPRCGTSIYATGLGDGPKVHSLRFGTLKQRDALTPKRQIWTRSRVAWLGDLAAVPGDERQPG